MPRSERSVHVLGSAAVALALALQTASCSATSRVGQAVVTEAGGRPCFAIPDEPQTRRKDIRLYAVAVSETGSTSWKTAPAQLWSFTADPLAAGLQVRPGACIRYGELPASAKIGQEPAALQPERVYAVEISAGPASASSSTRGYKAEFCVKPAPNGGLTVHTVPWDEGAKRWRHEVCAGAAARP